MHEPAERFCLVSYATEAFYPYRDRMVASAERHGIEIAPLWNADRLRATDFYAENKAILDFRRGAGYWLWKPYAILQALEAARPDALILYIDSAIEVVDDVSPLRDLLRRGEEIMVFQDGRYLQNKCYTKRDAFVLMECDEPRYWFAPQLQAGVMAFRKTEGSMAFVREWLDYCRDPRILTDQPNEAGAPNWTDFIDHRHDQSVLTNLVLKKGILPYRELSTTGREFSVHLDFRDDRGVDHALDYRLRPSPYGVLIQRDLTRPPSQPSFARRVLNRVNRALEWV